MRTILLISAALALPLGATSALADDHVEEMQEQRMQDVSWARVVLTKFKQGQRERAIEIIRDYFAKADANSGVQSGVHGIHLDTGEWDAMYVFPMKGGPADMTWVTSPDDIRWMNAMVALTGSQEQAMKLIAEFDSLIAAQTSYIGHAHPDH